MKSKQRQIYLKIQELLSAFHRTESNSQVYFMSFLNKKASLSDKKKLREKLIHHIKSQTGYKDNDLNWDELLKLKTKPFVPGLGLSISYCNYLAVCAIVFDQKVSIGFDIEHKERVTNRLVERISSQKEISQCPHPALLWTAKEAGVKSLSSHSQPVLFKNCRLSNWKKNSANQNYFFDFCAGKGHKYKGTAGFLNGLALAYAQRPFKGE